MPTADRILSWATAVANDWQWLAMAWHVALAMLLLAVLARQRLSNRVLGLLLVVPLTSVAVVAWASGNVFNGLVFSVIGGLLLRIAVGLPRRPAVGAARASRLAGAALLFFGWTYPHFLRTDNWTAYLYASPLGLLPCPTLAIVIGVTLMSRELRSTSWSLVVSTAGIAYGLIGVFLLRVWIDVWLLAGGSLVGILAAWSCLGQRVSPTASSTGDGYTATSGRAQFRRGARNFALCFRTPAVRAKHPSDSAHVP